MWCLPAIAVGEVGAESETRAITAGGRAITAGGRAITAGGRAITAGGRAITAGGRADSGGSRAITAGGRAITAGGRAITAGGRGDSGGSQAITAGGRAITAGGRAITAGGRSSIGVEGPLVVGRVSYVGSDFVSVLGQTVFVDRGANVNIREGSFVAIYGSIDFDTGGIVGATLFDAGEVGFDPGTSYLTGFVDSIDYSKGMAVVSGKAVDYTAWLSSGAAPSVGDMVSVTGRDYSGTDVLIADPSLRLELN